MSAKDRLESILSESRIRAMRTFFAQVPVVCFTESTQRGLEYMIGEAGFEPWGIVFHREAVFAQGGGPVFHLRGDEWEARESLPLRLQSRFIKFAEGEAEWTEEREWRVPYEEGEAGFEFHPDEVEAVIVGDTDWPHPEPDMELALVLGETAAQMYEGPPTWFHGYSRWWWNGERLDYL